MPLNLTITYRYDNAGNMIFRGEEAYTQGATGDYASERTFGYDNPSWGDQMTEYDGYLSAYDALGNPVSYYAATNYSFTWEGRQLKTAVAFGKTHLFPKEYLFRFPSLLKE